MGNREAHRATKARVTWWLPSPRVTTRNYVCMKEASVRSHAPDGAGKCRVETTPSPRSSANATSHESFAADAVAYNQVPAASSTGTAVAPTQLDPGQLGAAKEARGGRALASGGPDPGNRRDQWRLIVALTRTSHQPNKRALRQQQAHVNGHLEPGAMALATADTDVLRHILRAVTRTLRWTLRGRTRRWRMPCAGKSWHHS